jgi:hypothetical protein
MARASIYQILEKFRKAGLVEKNDLKVVGPESFQDLVKKLGYDLALVYTAVAGNGLLVVLSPRQLGLALAVGRKFRHVVDASDLAVIDGVVRRIVHSNGDLALVADPSGYMLVRRIEKNVYEIVKRVQKFLLDNIASSDVEKFEILKRAAEGVVDKKTYRLLTLDVVAKAGDYYARRFLEDLLDLEPLEDDTAMFFYRVLRLGLQSSEAMERVFVLLRDVLSEAEHRRVVFALMYANWRRLMAEAGKNEPLIAKTLELSERLPLVEPTEENVRKLIAYLDRKAVELLSKAVNSITSQLTEDYLECNVELAEPTVRLYPEPELVFTVQRRIEARFTRYVEKSKFYATTRKLRRLGFKFYPSPQTWMCTVSVDVYVPGSVNVRVL